MSKKSWRADRLVCICETTFQSIFEMAVTIINRNVNIEHTGQKGPEGFGTSYIITSYVHLKGGNCRGITQILRLPSRPSHPYGRQPHSLIFMSTLYKASSRLPASI